MILNNHYNGTIMTKLEKPSGETRQIKVNLKEVPKEVREKNRSTAYKYVV